MGRWDKGIVNVVGLPHLNRRYTNHKIYQKFTKHDQKGGRREPPGPPAVVSNKNSLSL